MSSKTLNFIHHTISNQIMQLIAFLNTLHQVIHDLYSRIQITITLHQVIHDLYSGILLYSRILTFFSSHAEHTEALVNQSLAQQHLPQIPAAARSKTKSSTSKHKHQPSQASKQVISNEEEEEEEVQASDNEEQPPKKACPKDKDKHTPSDLEVEELNILVAPFHTRQLLPRLLRHGHEQASIRSPPQHHQNQAPASSERAHHLVSSPSLQRKRTSSSMSQQQLPPQPKNPLAVSKKVPPIFVHCFQCTPYTLWLLQRRQRW